MFKALLLALALLCGGVSIVPVEAAPPPMPSKNDAERWNRVADLADRALADNQALRNNLDEIGLIKLQLEKDKVDLTAQVKDLTGWGVEWQSTANKLYEEVDRLKGWGKKMLFLGLVLGSCVFGLVGFTVGRATASMFRPVVLAQGAPPSPPPAVPARPSGDGGYTAGHEAGLRGDPLPESASPEYKMGHGDALGYLENHRLAQARTDAVKKVEEEAPAPTASAEPAKVTKTPAKKRKGASRK